MLETNCIKKARNEKSTFDLRWAYMWPLRNKFICIKLATFDTHFVHKILRKRFEDEGQSRDDICILFISLKINVYCLCKVFVKRFFKMKSKIHSDHCLV